MRRNSIAAAVAACVALASLVAVEPTAVAAVGPSVGRVSANTGKTAGGQRVTLHGAGFTRVAWVKFGTAYGRAIRVLSSTQLQVTTPAHAAGVVNVTVRSAYGTSATRIQDRFTFIAPPAITSIAPTSGSTTGGARVTVVGRRFFRVSSVKFGSMSGTAVSVLSSTKLLVTAPAHAAGPVDLRVTTAYGTSSATAQDHFTFVAPGVTPAASDGPSAVPSGPNPSPSGPIPGPGVPPVYGLAAKAATATSIRLSWTNPAGVTLAGQVVRRAIGATPPTTVNSGDAGTTISGDGSTFVDSGLQPGTQYSYSVFAVTSSGSSAGTSATATTLSPGTITGTVTSASGGAPLAGVRVEVYQSGDGTPSSAGRGSAVTGADGTYTVTGIAPGLQYGVCFDASGVGAGSSTGYQDQCWNGVAWDGGTTPTATMFTVDPGTVTSGINAALLAGGAITGDVSSASGPLAGVTVRVYEEAYGAISAIVATTTTAADGTYEVDGLTPRGYGYLVCFEDDSASSYVAQCSNNTPWTDLDYPPNPGTPVQVTAGNTQGGINAVLAQGGIVTGTITASADGTPLAGVAVSIDGSGTGSNYGAAAQSTTAADGTYTLRGIPAGTNYQVCGDPSHVTGASETGYVRSCGPSSTDVAVGETTDAGNLALSSAAGVSGTVTAAIGGAPLSGVHVVVAQPGLPGIDERTATTRADGTYSIVGVPPLPAGQSYVIAFYGGAADGGQSMTGYLSPPAEGLSVAPGVFTTVDETLQSAGAITGTVTALDGGAPLNRVAVELYDSSGSSIGNVWTDANGFYAYPALLPTSSGGYTVCFDPRNVVGGSSPTGYVGNCYKNVEPWLESVPPSGTTPVPVTAQAVTGSIDAALSTGGAISGTVTHQGNPVANATVFWFGPGVHGALTSTDANGNYTAIGLPPSTTDYTICFWSWSLSGAENPTCYNNEPWSGAPNSQPPAGANPVPIIAGSTTTGVDGTL